MYYILLYFIIFIIKLFLLTTSSNLSNPARNIKKNKKAETHRCTLCFSALAFVTASGFKPETFSSVVRCSIQLSYAAKPFFGSAKIGISPKLQKLFLHPSPPDLYTCNCTRYATGNLVFGKGKRCFH